MANIIIVGTGLAGYNLAKELRKLDGDTPLTLLTADAGDFYSKPMLSTGLTQKKAADQLVMSSAAKMAEQLRADVRTHTPVMAIDTTRCQIQLGDNEIPYRRLVLAVGAHQVLPTLGGSGVKDVMTVNNLADYTEFRRRIASSKHIAIVGAGLIGCEFANDLANAGIRTTVINLGNAPLSPPLPEVFTQHLATKLSALGVEWRFGTHVTEVNSTARGYEVSLANGDKLAVDAVLSATGLRSNTSLAAQAGIGINRGIVVDSFLKTSAANVYALGDCVELNGQVLPYVMPLMTQARALAKTLAGTPTEVVYPVMPVVVKTPAFSVVFVPPTAPGARWETSGDSDGARALAYDKNDRLCGFALGGKAIAEKTNWSNQLGKA